MTIRLDGRRASSLLLAATMTALAVDIYDIGFAYIDNFRILETASRHTWTELAVNAGNRSEMYRPLNLLITKAVLAIRGADFFVFRTAHLFIVGVLFLAWMKACDPRTWADFLRFGIATACVVGLHTSRHLFHGIPLNPYTIVSAAALWAFVLARRAPGPLAAVWPPLLTAIAVLTLELGVVVPVILLTGYIVGWRGASRSGLAGAAAVCVLYVAARAMWSSGVESLPFYTETGFGFETADLTEQRQWFGTQPVLFYIYNVASTLLTVVASEPRSGEFVFIEGLWDASVSASGWQWVNVLASIATSSVIVWALLRGRLERRERHLILVAGAGILVNAALGFLYVRDRIPSLAGLLYGVCLYVSLLPVVDRLCSVRPLRVRRLAAASIVVLSAAWGLRCAATQEYLEDLAWANRQEWIGRRVPYLRPASEAEAAVNVLFIHLQKQAIADVEPDPRLDATWTHQWLERDVSVR